MADVGEGIRKQKESLTYGQTRNLAALMTRSQLPEVPPEEVRSRMHVNIDRPDAIVLSDFFQRAGVVDHEELPGFEAYLRARIDQLDDQPLEERDFSPIDDSVYEALFDVQREWTLSMSGEIFWQRLNRLHDLGASIVREAALLTYS